MRVANLKTKQQTNQEQALFSGVAAQMSAHARRACGRKGREWGNARVMAMPCGRHANACTN
jgi:hypothetical protein